MVVSDYENEACVEKPETPLQQCLRLADELLQMQQQNNSEFIEIGVNIFGVHDFRNDPIPTEEKADEPLGKIQVLNSMLKRLKRDAIEGSKIIDAIKREI